MSVVFIAMNKKATYNLPDSVLLFPDCTTSLDHTFENDVTEHAVELSGSFTDHVQVKNNQFSISGVYSENPFNKNVSDSIPFADRLQQAYNFLLDLRNSRRLFTVVSKYASYPNCVIKRLSIPISPDTGNQLVFNMDVTQVRIATSENIRIANVENIKDEFVVPATPQQSKGRLQGKLNDSKDVDKLNNIYVQGLPVRGG
jgi:ribosome-associated toxin RatA of RatAB toxin-antitoxin module